MGKHSFCDLSLEDLYEQKSYTLWDGIHLRGTHGQLAYTESVIKILNTILKYNCEPPLKKLKVVLQFECFHLCAHHLKKLKVVHLDANTQTEEHHLQKIMSENNNSSYLQYCNVM